MIPIELKKRYPHSRVEDITDAFMRGYQACADALQGGDAKMDNCQVQAPQNYMQQSRHNDGKDLISRADAMGAVQDHFNADGFNGYDDGQKMMDRIKALPSAELTLQTPQTYGKSINPSNAEVVEDLISRSDAIGIIEDYIGKDYMTPMSRLYSVRSELSALPSADAEPTVIRSRTLMPTKDFKEWAKRVRETNPNAVVIPCDAEVVSADAVQGEWIDVKNEPYCECSVCGSYIDNLDDDYAFCPRCGARMKGGTK